MLQAIRTSRKPFMRPKQLKKEIKVESNDKEEKDPDASSGSDDEIKELKAKQNVPDL